MLEPLQNNVPATTNPANTAIYNFNSSGGSCPAATVNGSYVTGVALDASNTVTMSVNVPSAGTYTISTQTQNGIQFTGSGSFTTNGTQTVTLTGSGTPGTAGVYAFQPNGGTCGFNIPVTSSPGPPPPPPPPPPSIATFTLTGAPGICSGASFTGTYTQGVACDPAVNKLVLNVNVTVLGSWGVIVPPGSVPGLNISGTGTFTVLGNQTISLPVTGTPTASGLYPVTPVGPSGNPPVATMCTTGLTVM